MSYATRGNRAVPRYLKKGKILFILYNQLGFYNMSLNKQQFLSVLGFIQASHSNQSQLSQMNCILSQTLVLKWIEFMWRWVDGYPSISHILPHPQRNSAVAQLYEDAVQKEGAVISSNGALINFSGKKTGRSPRDKRIVFEETSMDDIWWGPVNIRMPEHVFEINRERWVDVFIILLWSHTPTQCHRLPQHTRWCLRRWRFRWLGSKVQNQS